MMNKEILEKAIQKAIDGGWKYPFHANCYEIHKYVKARPESIAFGFREEWQDDGQHLEGHWSIEELIYNHDFAKALWDKPFPGTNIPATYEINLDDVPAWKYHLQQMVIADDSVAYLGEHI